VNVVKKSQHVAAVVIGGGKIARKFIQAAREFQANESRCDTFGIQASRLNALLLITALDSRAYPVVIESPRSFNLNAVTASISQRIMVAGGFIPGQSTTSVTFQIAEMLEATDVIILTDVDGIYDKDPNKYQNAVKFDSIDISKLEEVIFGNSSHKQAAAGEYRIFDAVSLQILKRSSFRVRLINGNDPNALQTLLVQENFTASFGTTVVKEMTKK
ncbi:MAG TPA: UMP kinase, partial [Bacteroidetes bacterium]|nr:UMP kinase [Bacteroidota bacterium]